MKNRTHLIFTFAFCALLGSSALKAQNCTVVFKPNALTDEKLNVDQTIQFATALNKCNTAGKISQIIVKYRNSFYNNNSPALLNLQVNIGQADNTVLQLTPTENSVIKGVVVNNPMSQTYTATLTFTGNMPQYLPTEQYIEIKALAYSGSTTNFLLNWIDEIDIVTIP